ncbi:MAG TPA: tetratricopeptide repeat protein, partial [Thermomicrobiales bacterium]|nr:tetratricopeptide repeat protein [Thermomicrobiales bacterium]
MAHAIETIEGAGADRRAAEIAFHYVWSGDRERARAWSERAAAQSMRSGAFSETADHLRNAVGAARDDDPDLGLLLLALGDAETLADADAAAPTLARAVDWFRARGETVRAASALRLLGQAHARRERHADARIAFETALAMLRAGADRERIETLVALGALLTASLHDYDRALAALEEGMTLAAAAGDPGLMARTRRAVGNLRVRQGKLREGIALLETALALAEEMDDSVEAAECCGCLAPAWFWLGELERSAAITLRRLDHAERTRDPYQLRHVFTWLAICSGIRGRIDEAHRWVEQADRQVSTYVSPEPAAFLDFVRGALASVHEDHERARDLLESAIGRFRAIGPGAL